jgi:glucose-6-phosphate isomerase, archaeal
VPVVDLTERTGIGLALEGAELRPAPGVTATEVKTRGRELLEPVCMVPEAAPEAGYTVFEDLARELDRPVLDRSGLRYDVLMLPSGEFGPEYAKTAGHSHVIPAGARASYPEILVVLHGVCHHVVQSEADPPNTHVGLAVAHAGDFLWVPPGFGHVLINANPEHLVVASVTARANRNIHAHFQAHHGAAHYALKRSGELRWQANPHYTQLTFPEPAAPLPPGLVTAGRPLYTALVEQPAALSALLTPDDLVVAG